MQNQNQNQTVSGISTGWPTVIGDPNHRRNKPDDRWTSRDIAVEFMARTYEWDHEITNVPGADVGRIINGLIREGMTTIQCLQMVRRFFEDEIDNYLLEIINGITIWECFMRFSYGQIKYVVPPAVRHEVSRKLRQVAYPTLKSLL
jgi:hypothetical protein